MENAQTETSDHAAPPRYCIIGAGACGLPLVKAFAERGIPFDCFERESEIGGVWNAESPHVVYGSTYLNSSKKLSRYPDFPMPEDFPHYLSRDQAFAYLKAYADAFGLRPRISFGKTVETVERVGEGWRVRIAGEAEPRRYDGVAVANGHHWSPKRPTHPGPFAGEVMHAHDLKSREALMGKRVLVIGAGNSASDIVCDAALFAAKAVHSIRRSYFLVPKLVMGQPTDRLIDLTSRWPLPRIVMRGLYRAGLRLYVGPLRRYGLPNPDHGLFEKHPTVTTSYLDHVSHGRIAVKPEVEKFEGSRVRFSDGSSEEVDLVVYGTGYQLEFPFLDRSLIFDAQGRSGLFLHLFHRELDNFFVLGLFEPAEGGVWQLADYQARLVASFIVAQARDPKCYAWFRKLKATAKPDIGHGIRWQETDWHRFEIQHYRYRRFMKWLLDRFGPTAKARLSSSVAVGDNEPHLSLAS